MKKIQKRYKKLILDFDGVIVDSNKFKENSIREAALIYKDPIETNKFCKYFTDNNGLSRKEKIFYFFGNNEISKKILEEYNDLILKRYNECNPTKKAKEFLININNNGYYPYILSGGDKNEISSFINTKLSDFKFEKIHDQSNNKEFWINKIIKENNLKGNEIIFIGDSKIDEQAARSYGLDFIYMKKYSQHKEYFKNKNQITIETLDELINSKLLFIIE